MVYNVMLLYICINCEKITMIKLNDFFITSTVILVCVCREDLRVIFLRDFMCILQCCQLQSPCCVRRPEFAIPDN